MYDTNNQVQKVCDEQIEKLTFFIYNFSNNYDGLLGFDILQPLKTKIDLENSIIHMNGIRCKFVGGNIDKPN